MPSHPCFRLRLILALLIVLSIPAPAFASSGEAIAGVETLPEETSGHVRVKANGIGWPMLVPDIALEVDLHGRWSVNLLQAFR